MKKFTEAEANNIIKDYFDPERVVLICSKHGYIGGSNKVPVTGCVECSTVFWRHWAGKRNPNNRTEDLEKMVALVKHLIKHEAELATVKLNRHPEVTIAKGKEN